MLISAIIPTRGTRPALLARAIESVRAQSRRPDEIILAIDGDRPLTEHEADARIVLGGRARGASATRNWGAREARGAFLSFLDDDDAWKPSYLQRAFESGDDFDVALTAFEKHNGAGIAVEKIPPAVLHPQIFLVRNPGLRGSNLIIRRAVYDAVGGFDPWLPAFNDLDFGLRLAAVPGLRYRRVIDPLVEFHVHSGERLSTPGSAANRAGLARYWSRYRSRMSAEERELFRARAIELWGLDPVALLEESEWGLFVEAAAKWAADRPPSIHWLLGPPGAGKTTWMRALAEAAPEIPAVELGEILRGELRFDGHTAGGLKRMSAAVRELRAAWRSTEKSPRVIVATSLPEDCLPIDPGIERVVLLQPDASALGRQRTMRRIERSQDIERAEIDRLDRWHRTFAARHPFESLTPPFFPTLLGRGSTQAVER